MQILERIYYEQNQHRIDLNRIIITCNVFDDWSDGVWLYWFCSAVPVEIVEHLLCSSALSPPRDEYLHTYHVAFFSKHSKLVFGAATRQYYVGSAGRCGRAAWNGRKAAAQKRIERSVNDICVSIHQLRASVIKNMKTSFLLLERSSIGALNLALLIGQTTRRRCNAFGARSEIVHRELDRASEAVR